MTKLPHLLQQYVLPPAFFQMLRKVIKWMKSPGGISVLDEHAVQAVPDAVDRPDPSPPSKELTEEICRNYRVAKNQQQCTPTPYKPGADWAKILEVTWKDFRQAVSVHDLDWLDEFFRNFFRQPVMWGFWGGSAETLHKMKGVFQRQYKIWTELEPREEIGRLEAPPIGNPWGFRVHGRLLIEPMFEYWWQAGFIDRLTSGVKRPVVLEIGGGLGGLAYSLGKRVENLCYIGIDLPENIALQQYYISRAYPEKRVTGWCEDAVRGLTSDELVQSDFVLLPNYMLEHLPAKFADVIVNVRSLAEMPDITIKEYLSQIDRLGKRWFFHENIYKKRKDALHGIPTNLWPKLQNFALVFDAISRWPRYDAMSSYPCKEFLYLSKNPERHESVPPV
ncbi:MAG: putative sugar O-methyltransferase [Verrucomicrobiota bacterium]